MTAAQPNTKAVTTTELVAHDANASESGREPSARDDEGEEEERGRMSASLLTALVSVVPSSMILTGCGSPAAPAERICFKTPSSCLVMDTLTTSSGSPPTPGNSHRPTTAIGLRADGCARGGCCWATPESGDDASGCASIENAEVASKAIAIATTPTQVRGREHTDAAKANKAAGLALGFLFALLARGDDDFFLDIIFGFFLDILNDLLLLPNTTANLGR